jgi:hypothetical protein
MTETTIRKAEQEISRIINNKAGGINRKTRSDNNTIIVIIISLRIFSIFFYIIIGCFMVVNVWGSLKNYSYK